MQASFTGISKVTVEPNPDGKSSRHIATDFTLEVSKNQDKKAFLDFHGRPKKEGIKPLTVTFIQGLIGNIHFAHEKGYWDSAEHLSYIIEKLTEGFAEVAHTSEGFMEPD